jgi:hypothetical protein
MITNTGKEIIAKYLLGTAPAYASYIALGCGSKPRITGNTLTGASSSGATITVTDSSKLWVGAKIVLSSQETVEISDAGTVGSISGTGPWTATITGMTTTVGLSVGDKITATAGTGSLGGGAGTYIISAISSSTSIIFTATGGTTPTAGTISDINYGTGQLDPDQDTIVTSVPNATTFTVSPSPTISLYGATITIQTDPSKKSLDFEMFRIPITSRGYINDNGTNKVILTGELPTEERYEISEVGIFSAGSNVVASSSDSKTITAFSSRDNWQYNSGTALSTPVTLVSISDTNYNITTTADAFQTTSDNSVFLNSTIRSDRYETCRYLNNIYMMRGSTGNLTGSAGSFSKVTSSKFLQITNQTVDLSSNSTSDLLKVALSLIAVSGSGSVVPDKLKVMVEFANGDGTQYARLEDELQESEYLENRYIVITKRLDELTYSTIFDWREVSVIRIYVSTIDTITATNKVGSGTTATLTTSAHGIPVNATITGATVVGSEITYVANNSFIPGDIVTISGITPSTLNASNQIVIEANATSFKISNAAVTGTYSSGGTGIIQNYYVTVSNANGSDTGFDGTFVLTSVPSTTSIVYARTGTVVGSTGITGSVDIYRHEYYIGLDAIRFDNISTINPLYGMTGYSIIQNATESTIVKPANTNNYIEYRFILDVT